MIAVKPLPKKDPCKDCGEVVYFSCWPPECHKCDIQIFGYHKYDSGEVEKWDCMCRIHCHHLCHHCCVCKIPNEKCYS